MMIPSMVRAAGILLILTGAGLHAAAPANEALFCAWDRGHNPDMTIRHCTAAIEKGGLPDAGLAAVFSRRCRAYIQKRDYTRALPDCERAIQLAPAAALPFYWRGWVRFRSGNLDGAMLDFEKATLLDPNSAWAYGSRASVYKKRGQYDEAIQDYGEALRLKPDGESHYGRGWCYVHKGDYEWAKPDFDEAIRLGVGADAYYGRGLCYVYTFDYSRAIADFDQAIRLDPKLAVAYSSRAWVYARRGDYDQAIRDYTQALRLAPTAELYNGRGSALYHKGAYLLAFWDFARSSWHVWTPIFALTCLLYILGRRRKAMHPQAPTEDSEAQPPPDNVEPFVEIPSDAPVPDPELPPESPAPPDLNALIRTGMRDPVAIALTESLFREAGTPFFVMDQNVVARQQSGNFFGWWNIRVPREREAEARQIIQTVEEMK